MTVVQFVALLTGGIAAGLGNTLVGGGSLFSLPVLLVLGLGPAEAIGTNRFAVVFLAASGAASYRRQKVFSFRDATSLSLVMSLGALAGALITVSLPESVLSGIVLSLLGVFSLLIFLHPNRPLDARFVNFLAKPPIKFTVLLMLGLYGGFIGVAVTTMTIIFLRRIEGQSLFKSLAINQTAVCALSIVAAAVFFVHDAILFFPGIVLAVGMATGAYAGPFLALRLGEKRLEHLLKLTVIVLFVRAAWEVLEQ